MVDKESQAEKLDKNCIEQNEEPKTSDKNEVNAEIMSNVKVIFLFLYCLLKG